jgi:hypothetical protein
MFNSFVGHQLVVASGVIKIVWPGQGEIAFAGFGQYSNDVKDFSINPLS